MSEDRFSLGEFSEFLDDSEGHRLAHFLQKKTGTVRNVRPLFDCGSLRFSLNVKSKRISSPKKSSPPKSQPMGPQEVNDTVDVIIPETPALNVSIKSEEEDNNDDDASPTKGEGQQPAELRPSVTIIENLSISQQIQENAVPEAEQRTIANRVSMIVEPPTPAAAEPAEEPAIVVNSLRLPLSPRGLSPLRRSGGVISSADRLRRSTLKRLTQQNAGGRRTLLKEFESTLSSPLDFCPLIQSTPLSQPRVNMPTTPPRNSRSTSENARSAEMNNGQPTDKTLSALRHTDQELRKMLENVVEVSIKKCHEKENDMYLRKSQSFERLHVTTAPKSRIDKLLTPPSRRSSVHVAEGVAENSINTSHFSNRDIEKLCRDVGSLVELGKRRASVSIPKIVIPVQQTFNGLPAPEANKTTRQERAEPEKNESNRRKTEQGTTKANVQSTQSEPTTSEKSQRKISVAMPPSNDPPLELLITDDESAAETVPHPKATTPEKSQRKISVAMPPSNDPPLESLITDDESAAEIVPHPKAIRRSGIPLNLAAGKLQQTRRLRKRINSKRRPSTTHTPVSPTASTETESEGGPPPAHPLTGRPTIRPSAAHQRPLNKAPSTPINGEKFAAEIKTQLARMTNYEILDLRKRNSIGEGFPLVAAAQRSRKHSAAASKLQPLEQQLLLEEQIDIEILRRTLEGNNEGLKELTEKKGEEVRGDLRCEGRDEDIFAEMPPVPPEEFQDRQDDLLTQITSQLDRDTSLIDERSCDRVSFRPTQPQKSTSSKNKSHKGGRKSKKDMAEIVQKYIEVHETIINRSKSRKQSRSNSIKRSLYSKGHSDSEGEDNSPSAPKDTTSNEGSKKGNASASNKQSVSISLSRSPARNSGSPLASPARPSRKSSTRNGDNPIEILPPPSPFVDRADTQTRGVHSDETEEGVFKKPLLPAPKSRNQAKKNKTKRQNPSSTTEMEEAEGEEPSLRRSKRGHVPLSEKWSLPQILFQEQMNKRLEQNKRQRMRAIERKLNSVDSTTNSTAHSIVMPVANSTANSLSKVSTTTMHTQNNNPPSKIKRGRLRNAKKATPIPEINFLGDTNATCDTTPSTSNRSDAFLAQSEARINRMTRRLSAIYEPPMENENQSEGEDMERDPVRCVETASAPATACDDEPLTTATKKQRRRAAKNTAKTATAPSPPKARKTVSGLDHQRLDVPTACDDEPLTTATKKQRRRAAKNSAKTATAPSPPKARKTVSGLEHQRLDVPPAPIEELNSIFDQLKNAAEGEGQQHNEPPSTSTDSTTTTGNESNRVRKLRVRVKRLKTTNSSTSTSVSVNSRQQSQEGGGGKEGREKPPNYNRDLASWLKGVSEADVGQVHRQIFKDMRCSAAGNLVFSDLEGIDFAFYDTDEKASLGYMRFKPRQKKPAKRAKKYHLHFVVLSGLFDIGTDREHGTFGVGDLVAINTGCRYTIENLSNDDVGLLMVIKKTGTFV